MKTERFSNVAAMALLCIVPRTEKFFYEILEPEIRVEDPDTPYTPGSPVGIAHNEGVYSDNVGDTHLWGVWHGLYVCWVWRGLLLPAAVPRPIT